MNILWRNLVSMYIYKYTFYANIVKISGLLHMFLEFNIRLTNNIHNENNMW